MYIVVAFIIFFIYFSYVVKPKKNRAKLLNHFLSENGFLGWKLNLKTETFKKIEVEGTILSKKNNKQYNLGTLTEVVKTSLGFKQKKCIVIFNEKNKIISYLEINEKNLHYLKNDFNFDNFVGKNLFFDIIMSEGENWREIYPGEHSYNLLYTFEQAIKSLKE